MDAEPASLNHDNLSDIEKIDTTADIIQECNSTCESSEMVLTCSAECDTKPELHSQAPSHSCPDSDLCHGESDNVTPDLITVLQSPSQNGEETSPENISLVVSFSFPTVSNTQTSLTDNEVQQISSSNLWNDLPSVTDNIESVKSSCLDLDIKSSTSPVDEKVGSSIQYNHETQSSDLINCSDHQMSECGDSALHPSTNPCNDLLNVTDNVVESVKSSCLDLDIKSTTSPVDSLIHYNQETQLSDSINCSDHQMSECGDSVLDPSSDGHQADKEHTDTSNGCSSHKKEGTVQDSIVPSGTDDCSMLNVSVKQEPYDSDDERPELKYRNGTIVVDSDDDTSSTMFSDDGVGGNNDNIISDEEIVERQNANESILFKNRSRTEGEVFPEDLPTVEYMTISPDESVILEPLGAVSGVVGVLVIVKAKLDCPALYDDTVLFLEGRQPLGLIFEVFGTVEQPYYSVRFNSAKDITDRNITVGDKVFFAPKVDNLTKYVFIAELRKMKCDDASWENDNEPPPAHVEFSDDEEERRARQRQRNKERGIEENQGVSVRRKKRRSKPNLVNGKDSHGPQLLQGDLNRNPFGNKDKMFSSSTSHWPKSDIYGHRGNGQRHSFPNQRPHFSPRSSPQPPPTAFNAYRQQWPPQAGFGERPGWNCQSGLFGDLPNASMIGSPNMGSFGNRNMFSPQQFRPPPPPRFIGMPLLSPPGQRSGLPQSFLPSQQNNFGCGPYFSRSNMQHTNPLAPPLSQIPHQHIGQPHSFPMFNPSCPPPVVRSVFTHPSTPK